MIGNAGGEQTIHVELVIHEEAHRLALHAEVVRAQREHVVRLVVHEDAADMSTSLVLVHLIFIGIIAVAWMYCETGDAQRQHAVFGRRLDDVLVALVY